MQVQSPPTCSWCAKVPTSVSIETVNCHETQHSRTLNNCTCVNLVLLEADVEFIFHVVLRSDRVTPFGVVQKSAILQTAVTAPSPNCWLLQLFCGIIDLSAAAASSTPHLYFVSLFILFYFFVRHFPVPGIIYTEMFDIVDKNLV